MMPITGVIPLPPGKSKISFCCLFVVPGCNLPSGGITSSWRRSPSTLHSKLLNFPCPLSSPLPATHRPGPSKWNRTAYFAADLGGKVLTGQEMNVSF